MHFYENTLPRCQLFGLFFRTVTRTALPQTQPCHWETLRVALDNSVSSAHPHIERNSRVVSSAGRTNEVDETWIVTKSCGTLRVVSGLEANRSRSSRSITASASSGPRRMPAGNSRSVRTHAVVPKDGGPTRPGCNKLHHQRLLKIESWRFPPLSDLIELLLRRAVVQPLSDVVFLCSLGIREVCTCDGARELPTGKSV